MKTALQKMYCSDGLLLTNEKSEGNEIQTRSYFNNKNTSIPHHVMNYTNTREVMSTSAG